VPFRGSRSGAGATWLHSTMADCWPKAVGPRAVDGNKKTKRANTILLSTWTLCMCRE
jgi:hypothetical protein